jgi:Dyp-type peroxidase family protein
VLIGRPDCARNYTHSAKLLSPVLGFNVVEGSKIFCAGSELSRQAQFYQNLCMMAVHKISSILRSTRGEGNMPQDNDPVLDLDEIQGDVLVGLQKNFENFIFFKIVNVPAFKAAMRQRVIGQITTTQQARERDRQNQQHPGHGEQWLGLNVSFTKDGLTKLLGPQRARLDPSFENGADNRATWLTLNDPPPSTWLTTFRSDTIDGVFFVPARKKRLLQTIVTHCSATSLTLLESSIKKWATSARAPREGASTLDF